MDTKDEQSGQEGPLDKEEWDLKDRASAGRLVSFFVLKTGKSGNFI